MTYCQVSADTVRYYTDEDRRDAYQAEISRRAEALIDSGDLDALTGQMSALEADRFYKAIAVVCQCATRASRDFATLEIRHLLTQAATALAKRQYQQEMDAATEQLAMERFYRQCERHGVAI